LPGDVHVLDGLPALPAIRLALYSGAATPSMACKRMAALIKEHIVG